MPLIPPYGGALVDLVATGDARAELQARAGELRSLQLSPRQMCDLELLASGALAPLDRFMGEADYTACLYDQRLADGTPFPLPLTLPVVEHFLYRAGQSVALRSPRNDLLGILDIEEVFASHWPHDALTLCGTSDVGHPFVAEMEGWGRYCLSGPVRLLELPRHGDFVDLRLSPAACRARLTAAGGGAVLAYPTRRVLHRAAEQLTQALAERCGARLLVQAQVGTEQPGDIGHFTRVRAVRALVEGYFEPARTTLGLLPQAPRPAGAREVLWQALLTRNHGGSHLLLDADSPTPDASAYGVELVVLPRVAYLPDEDLYDEVERILPERFPMSLTDEQVERDYLDPGRRLPEWFTRPEVAQILAEGHPPRDRQGCCLWFTGLPSSGKTTVAELVVPRLLELGRQVTVLDGDVVRTHLSKGLGFSKEDRDTNILRIGFVAAELVRHHGLALCAAVSPYRGARNQVRQMVGSDRFVEIYVSTPAETCEQRDAKGLYAQARAGRIKGFTGVDDPYEPPTAPELTLDTVNATAAENAATVLDYLASRGWLPHADQRSR